MIGHHLPRAAGVLLALVTLAGASPRIALMDSVTTLRRTGDLTAAATQLQTWVEAHPEDDSARMLLGQVLLDAGHEDQALDVWTAVLHNRPVDVDRYRAVSRRVQAMGRIEAALDILAHGAKRLGGSDPFAWQRAELLLDAGDWAGAVEAHRMFLQQEPHRRPLVENRIATMAANDSRTGSRTQGRARQYCRALAAAVPKTMDGHRANLLLLLSGCELETGDAAAGLRALQDAAGNRDMLTQALYPYASRCEAAEEFDVAAEAYGLFISRAPKSPYRSQAQLKQAEMLVLSGDADGALTRYLQLSTDSGAEASEALLRVARLQARALGDPQAALATLSRFSPEPEAPDLHRRLLSLRADCHLRLDDLASAARQWRQLLTDPEARGAAEFGLAEIAFFGGHFDTAAAYIDSLVLRHPTHPLANDALELLLLIDAYGAPGGVTSNALVVLARARLHERQGRDDEAHRDREWLHTQAPLALRHQSLLEVAARSETADMALALSLYDEILASEPEPLAAVGAALGRARMLEALGDPQAALRAYETAVLTTPLDPRTPEARRHINRLRTALGGSG